MFCCGIRFLGDLFWFNKHHYETKNHFAVYSTFAQMLFSSNDLILAYTKVVQAMFVRTKYVRSKIMLLTKSLFNLLSVLPVVHSPVLLPRWTVLQGATAWPTRWPTRTRPFSTRSIKTKCTRTTFSFTEIWWVEFFKKTSNEIFQDHDIFYWISEILKGMSEKKLFDQVLFDVDIFKYYR